MPSPEKIAAEEKYEPIVDTPEKVFYLGVGLEKAENKENAPNPENYSDYINNEFSLTLQRDIAVSFAQGDPLLIEGGTSIGKTTTVRKMASDLGWEVHYVNLNGATDASDLMGRYVPNPRKKSPDDPEYIFADGNVTSGLRQENGKQKVIILDELNASSPANLIRLHEILDALERDAEVVLSEDASEVVSVSKAKTKIVALINPPGKGFMQREALDPAQLRRWVYLKAATELPAEAFSESTDALFHTVSEKKEIPEEAFMFTNEALLKPEELAYIPGMKEITDRYKEFHKGAKQLVKSRTVAADQPQPFTYDDRMEPRRVRDFVCRFYKGDLNETFQAALKYYYSGKLLEATDKAKLQELIKHVEYVTPAGTTKRRPLGAPSTPESAEGLPYEEVRKIFEDMNYPEGLLGPEAIEATYQFGAPVEVPPIPFKKELLERFKDLGFQLVLQVGRTPDGKSFSMDEMTKRFNDSHAASLGQNVEILSDVNDLENLDVYKKETPRFGWKIASANIISSSINQNYLNQTESILKEIFDKIYQAGSVNDLPERYRNAWDEFDTAFNDIKDMLENGPANMAVRDLKKLHITNLTRERASEFYYRYIINFSQRNMNYWPDHLVWTSSQVKPDEFVIIGTSGTTSRVTVGSFPPDAAHTHIGASFSTMQL